MAIGTGNIEDFEKLMAFFVYRGGETKSHQLTRSSSPPPICNTSPHQPPEVSDAKTPEVHGDVEEPALRTPPKPPPPRRRRRRSSSYIRATVKGKPVVLSRFFPLPAEIATIRRTRSRTVASIIRPVSAADEHNDGEEEFGDSDALSRSTAKSRKKRRIFQQDIRGAASNEDGDGCGMEKNLERQTKDGDVGGAARKKPKRVSPQLSAAEKKSVAYRRVIAGNMAVPPQSGYNLLQESHFFDPWRVLIICMLLNVTTGKQVRRVLQELFDKWPDAEAMATRASVEELQELLRGLGLQRKRAGMLKRFTQEYLNPDWTYVTELYGIGKYAADAYAIFCAGMLEEVVPQDHKLVDYWKFVCGKPSMEERT